jgi:hypothetical protein
MKIVVVGFDTRCLPLYPSGTMNAAAPDGAPLRRIDKQQFKNSTPAVPLKRP